MVILVAMNGAIKTEKVPVEALKRSPVLWERYLLGNRLEGYASFVQNQLKDIFSRGAKNFMR